VHPFGDEAVNPGASDLLKYGSPFIRRSLQECGETTLGKEHGPGEAVEIHSCGFIDLFGHSPDLGLEKGACLAVCDLVFRGLELAVGFLPRTALAPMATEAPRPGTEGHLCKALPRLSGHDFVAAFRNPVQPGRSPVEGKADGVKNSCLTGSRGPRDGKDAVGGEGRVGQVNFPFPHK